MEDKILKLTNTVYKILEFFPESDPLKNRAKDKALVIMENLILLDEATPQSGASLARLEEARRDIDILLGYLWIGKTQGWLNSVNCLIITGEYEKIKKKFAPVIELPQQISGAEESLPEEEYMQAGFRDGLDSGAEELDAGEEDFFDFSEDLALQDVERDEAVVFSDDNAKFSHELTARQKKIIDFLTSNERAQVMDLKKMLPDITKRTIRRDLDELMELGKIVRFGDFNQVFYQIKHLG